MIVDDKYKTIKTPSEGYFKDRKSKFYAFAYPVSDDQQIKTIQKELRKKFYDARHHVYAFVLGKEKTNFRYSDDGEPANSSGPPIFNTIKSFDLTDVLIVVIRYFGGKKLGIPGLINAYRSAAEDAILNAQIIEKIIEVKVEIAFPYPLMSRVMYIVKKLSVNIISQDFSEACKLTCSIRESMVAQLKLQLETIGAKVY